MIMTKFNLPFPTVLEHDHRVLHRISFWNSIYLSGSPLHDYYWYEDEYMLVHILVMSIQGFKVLPFFSPAGLIPNFTSSSSKFNLHFTVNSSPLHLFHLFLPWYHWKLAVEKYGLGSVIFCSIIVFSWLFMNRNETCCVWIINILYFHLNKK